jgi:signal transduction histidine kinase
MGIRLRILFAFMALFLLVFAVTVGVSIALIARAVEGRLEAQTRNLARFFEGNRGIAASPGVLEHVRRAYDARSVEILPASGDPPADVVYRAPIGDGLELVMAFDPGLISSRKRDAVLPFATVALGGMFLVLLLGVLTARTIARPIEALGEQVKDLSKGEIRPVGGGPELDHLVSVMNRMLEEVRRAEQLAVMGRMAAGVAHELRNPLSSIKMTVQMLRQDAPDKEPHDLVLKEIERLDLAVAELGGEARPLQREPADLGHVVDEVLDLMDARLRHLSVTVERKFAPSPRVSVDVARFKRCAMNLVLNGAQAMPAGGPLEISIEPRSPGVRFSVSDAGAGIPPEIRDTLFAPFVTTKRDGVGLGLALTRKIVEDHGGAIGVEARERGSTFWIDLPEAGDG